MSHFGWNTEDEKVFIGGIGTYHDANKHAENRAVPGREAVIELLKGYIAGCRRRSLWGGMKRDEIISHAERRLEQLMAQGEVK